jgi:hypothetical protein
VHDERVDVTSFDRRSVRDASREVNGQRSCWAVEMERRGAPDGQALVEPLLGLCLLHSDPDTMALGVLR